MRRNGKERDEGKASDKICSNRSFRKSGKKNEKCHRAPFSRSISPISRIMSDYVTPVSRRGSARLTAPFHPSCTSCINPHY